METGQIPVWYASHPDHGIVCNFPVPLDVRDMDQEQFLTAFQHCMVFSSVKDQKHLLQTFPHYDPLLMSLAVINGKVVRHFMQFGLFMPPLHTLQDELDVGVWFDLLLAPAQREAEHMVGW
jgi:hypothetical protein